MSTATTTQRSRLLICSICARGYDQLYKGFPCQHSVCFGCMGDMIKSISLDDIQCPQCRTPFHIPEFEAAGFPNNTTLMNLVPPSNHAAQSNVCARHSKNVVKVFCITCKQAVCMTCAFKSIYHKGHEMEDLTDAMKSCVRQSKTLFERILTMCIAIEDGITEAAKSGDPDCMKLLSKLEKCLAVISQCHANDISVTEKPDAVAESRILVLQPGIFQTCPNLLRASMPKSSNLPYFQPLASTALPDFVHIDINRKNTLLITLPLGHHAIYDFVSTSFRSVESPALYFEIALAMSEVETVILSHDGRVVFSKKNVLFVGNDRYHLLIDKTFKISAFHGDWAVLTKHEKGKSLYEIVLVQHLDIDRVNRGNVSGGRLLTKCIRRGNMTGGNSVTKPLDGHEGVILFSVADHFQDYGDPSRLKKIKVSESGTVSCTSSPFLYSGDFRDAAVMKDLIFFLQGGDNTIKVYDSTRREYIKNITMRELGLCTKSTIKRIWAGDTNDESYVLHVLFADSRCNVLASYSVYVDAFVCKTSF